MTGTSASVAGRTVTCIFVLQKIKLPPQRDESCILPRYHPSCSARQACLTKPLGQRPTSPRPGNGGRARLSLLGWYHNLSVSGSGGIFGVVPAPGSHLSRTLWTGAPRLLVSINAFVLFRLLALCHRWDGLSRQLRIEIRHHHFSDDRQGR